MSGESLATSTYYSHRWIENNLTLKMSKGMCAAKVWSPFESSETRRYLKRAVRKTGIRERKNLRKMQLGQALLQETENCEIQSRPKVELMQQWHNGLGKSEKPARYHFWSRSVVFHGNRSTVRWTEAKIPRRKFFWPLQPKNIFSSVSS